MRELSIQSLGWISNRMLEESEIFQEDSDYRHFETNLGSIEHADDSVVIRLLIHDLIQRRLKGEIKEIPRRATIWITYRLLTLAACQERDTMTDEFKSVIKEVEGAEWY